MVLEEIQVPGGPGQLLLGCVVALLGRLDRGQIRFREEVRYLGEVVVLLHQDQDWFLAPHHLAEEGDLEEIRGCSSRITEIPGRSQEGGTCCSP